MNYRLSISILFLIGSIASVAAQSWTSLGSAKVNGAVDHDEIMVTSSRGDFSAIKLFVANEGIEFKNVLIYFGNGTHTEVGIKEFIPAGGETRVIDLPGHDRVLRKVVFYYKSNPKTSKKGKVILYGRY